MVLDFISSKFLIEFLMLFIYNYQKKVFLKKHKCSHKYLKKLVTKLVSQLYIIHNLIKVSLKCHFN